MQSAKQDRFLNQEKGSTMGWYSRSWRSRDGRETGIGKERKGDGEGRGGWRRSGWNVGRVYGIRSIRYKELEV